MNRRKFLQSLLIAPVAVAVITTSKGTKAEVVPNYGMVKDPHYGRTQDYWGNETDGIWPDAETYFGPDHHLDDSIEANYELGTFLR